MGTSNSVLDQATGSTTMAKVISLLAVIALVLIRPSGLFTTRERSYE
jgi:branched-subunit amino acid ABC-type transport system permease component